jgi:lipid-binding SYLF domain-containing protein
VLLLTVGALLATNAQAAKGGLDRRVAAALSNLAAKIPLAPELIGKASGILVFPQVYKAGFVFGGAVGDGALRVGGQTVQYYRTTAVSWGFQFGAQARTEVVLFMTQDALNRFREGNGWQAGVDGSIAVINFGAGNSIDTDNIQEPIIGFIFDDKGLMFDLSFKGNKYWKLDD